MGIQSETQGGQQATLARYGSLATLDEIKDSSCQGLGDGDCRDEQTLGYSIPCLPEDIWRHIHSLMPMDAAARAACLSQTFLSSWRCYSKLILSSQTVKKQNGSLRSRIDSILENHSGINVKILSLHLRNEYTCFPHIDRWLKVAVTPGIEELTLVSPFVYKKYSFTCSVLSEGVRNSIQSLQLDSCIFHVTAELGPFRSLTSLRLHSVCITGDELEWLLSNSTALECLDLKDCGEIISLKIPSVLQQLSYLLVDGCLALQIIENKAPSISNFSLFGRRVKLHATAELGLFRSLTSLCLCSVCITGDELECILSNSLALERLELKDCGEIISLKIPSVLQQLSYLLVDGCCALQIIEIKAPSISNFSLFGRRVKLHAMAELGLFRSLTSLRLRSVCITGDELECLLSNSLALERLELKDCGEIISLKIPSVLQQLRYLLVDRCCALQIIENKAPSISNFSLFGRCIKLLLGEASQTIKIFNLFVATAAGYARAKLPSIMPNLELLNLSSSHEENTPMLPSKFVYLKHLYIQITSSTLSPSYDYSSLISFLDASPSLETWRLEVPLADMGHELVGSSPLRQLPERHHDHLKIVEILGFHSTKSLVELTCCIVKSAVSLESLTLDTIRGYGRSPCCSDGLGQRYSKFVIEQASRAVVAIRRYIEDEIAPTTKLTVLEHCPQCVAAAVDDGMDCISNDGLA